MVTKYWCVVVAGGGDEGLRMSAAAFCRMRPHHITQVFLLSWATLTCYNTGSCSQSHEWRCYILGKVGMEKLSVFISFYIKVQSTNHSELQWSARLWGLRCYRGELWYWTNYNIQNMIRRSTPSYSNLKISYLVIKEYNKLVIYMLYSFYWMVTL